MKLYAPWEKVFNRISTPFEHFIHSQTSTGLVLVFTTILALVLANSPLSDYYYDLFHTNVDFNVGDWKLSHNIHHWINDGLMAIFFFMVGLEIKREILVGELSTFRDAILPILAAIGGMILPALIYYNINTGTIGENGWGIPMATDIAFAISAIILLGNRISHSLVTFLVALAIVDDIGAILVIAIFYTHEINYIALSLSGVSFFFMILFNRFGIHTIFPYFFVGIFMWFFMLESGVHATVAGVIAAMAIPSRPKLTPHDFTQHTSNLLQEYDNYPIATDNTMHEQQKAILLNIKDKIDSVSSPSAKLEHDLHLPVSLIIIPAFALANAGISINFSSFSQTLFEPVSVGIIAGLLLGKILGITGISYFAIKLKIAKLPSGSSMNQLLGVSALGGIGFTMSIFVAELAFAGNEALIFQAKVGILIASLIAGIAGYLWLRYSPFQY